MDELNIKDALNEYFKLKNKFEDINNKFKKKLLNNPSLSNREKRRQFLKYKPKCINCKQPSKKGTIFSIIPKSNEDNNSSTRIFKASCGNIIEPCNLNIEIEMASYDSIEDTLSILQDLIKGLKNEIIIDKNKLLFGLISTENALENFDKIKSDLNDMTVIYEEYLTTYFNIIDNNLRKLELNESMILYYQLIANIRENILKMKEFNDVKFAQDIAFIYESQLLPLLQKIRELKYKTNYVNNDDGICVLNQAKYSAIDIYLTSKKDKIISFDTGLKLIGEKTKKQKSKEELLAKEDTNERKINVSYLSTQRQIEEIPIQEPIFTTESLDGIIWENEYYQNLWQKLPEKLKNELKMNIDWMKEFMHNCVNTRLDPNSNGCSLTNPPNIIIPPKILANGSYDFGVKIYNDTFNKLSDNLKNTYLKLYKEDNQTKEKNYKMLEDALSDLIAKELDFGRGFF